MNQRIIDRFDKISCKGGKEGKPHKHVEACWSTWENAMDSGLQLLSLAISEFLQVEFSTAWTQEQLIRGCADGRGGWRKGHIYLIFEGDNQQESTLVDWGNKSGEFGKLFAPSWIVNKIKTKEPTQKQWSFWRSKDQTIHTECFQVLGLRLCGAS